MTYLTNREAALHLCNGGKLEVEIDGAWEEAFGGLINLAPYSIDQPCRARAAVETFQITVRGVTFDVPEPVREPLEEGQKYWVPAPVYDCLYVLFFWSDTNSDRRRHANGLIHLTEAAAVTHARAMCGVM